MSRKLLFSFVLWTLGTLIPSMAEQLTVYEDATASDQYVPIYGYYADAYLKCEYVVNAELLTDMNGKYITNLTWYIATKASKAWAGTFRVFITEVESTTLSSWQCTASDPVWEGTLDATGESISIELSTPYHYGGGNLVVGVYGVSPVTNDYARAYFKGEADVSGASIQGYSYESLDEINATQRNFVPTTTFGYVGAVIARPSDLTASDISFTSATVSWTAAGGEQSWLLGYKNHLSDEWTEIPATSTSVELTDLTYGTAYDVRVASVYADATSEFVTSSFSTPVCADDAEKATINYVLLFNASGGNGSWYGTKIVVRHSNGAEVATLMVTSNNQATGSFELCYDEPYDIVCTAAGTYPQYCAFQFTDVEGTPIYTHQDGDAFGEGVFTTYTPRRILLHKPSNLAASAVTYNSATLTWTPGADEIPQSQWEVEYMTSTDEQPTSVIVNGEPTVTLTGLTQNSTYAAHVRALSGEDASAYSSAIQFTTPEQFPHPEGLAVSDVKSDKATVAWESEAESANLRYRVSGQGERLLFESFESGIPSDWTIIDADADGKVWQRVQPASVFSNAALPTCDGNYALMSRSYDGSGGFEPDNWLISPQVELGGTLKFSVLDDASGYPETYGVFVSTRGTDPADFVQVGEDHQTPQSTTWTEVSFDLSEYAGEQGYVAIRHYNSYNQDFMFVDAISIYGPNVEPGEWTTVSGVTSPYTIEGLASETPYDVEVQAVYDGGESEWVASQFTTGAPDEVPVILAIEPTMTDAHVSWDGAQDLYTLRYRQQTLKNGFFEGFENGIPSDWTTYDEDNDGQTWDGGAAGTDSNGAPTGFGSGIATSASYNNNSGDLTPDNWLVTPEIELKGQLSVWLRAQDPSWAAEHFAIYVSTSGNTPDDFLDELVPETVSEGVLTEYTADLSDYEGQTGWIAIRHFNCTGQFRLNLDNFYVQYGPETEYEWTVVENIEENEYTIEGLEPGTDYELQVKGIYDGGESEWSEVQTFTTADHEAVTLAQALAEGEDGSTCYIGSRLAMVALSGDGNYIYVTDGEGNWARLAGAIVDYFNPTYTIFGLPDLMFTLSDLDTMPTLTLDGIDGVYRSVGEQYNLDELDLTRSVSEPLKPCQVMTVTGYFDGTKLRAYSGENGPMGQGLKLDNTNALTVGKQYSLTFAVTLLEPWDANGYSAPRRAPLGDTDAIDNIVAEVLDSEELDPAVTGIGDVKVDGAKGAVRYFDIMGRYIGTSLESAPSGLYIGSDGTKVRK